MNFPFISIVTPTKNRHHFLKNLFNIFSSQEYPPNKMELIILDDSIKPYSKEIKDPRIKYHYSKVSLELGQKRNILNGLAQGEIIICMDDDDYYPSTRVIHTVEMLQNNEHKIAGCSKIYIYSLIQKEFTVVGPKKDNHGTNGTLAYKKSYLKNHKYNENSKKSEEIEFTNNFSEKMIQLDPQKTILCISHNDNTVSKEKFFVSKNEKKIEFELKDWIKDEKIYNFYRNYKNLGS